MKKTRILTSESAPGLQQKINQQQEEGFQTVGSHKVVTTHSQNRYAGNQHKDTVHRQEYSITMEKEV